MQVLSKNSLRDGPNDSGNSDLDDLYGDQKASVLDIAYGLIEHSGEHYGQLVVYYRPAGLAPPESRRKSSRYPVLETCRPVPPQS